MAGRRPHRGPVRRQLRGGRREQHPPRRRRIGGVPVGDRRRAAVAGHAPRQHGIDLRVRLARRLLAPVADVHRARRAGHRLRRRDRDGAQPGGGRRHEGGGLGNRQPRPEVDRLQGLHPAAERAHLKEAIRIHTEVTGTRPLGIYTGRSSINTIALGGGGGRLRLFLRRLRRRSAVLGAGTERAVPDHPLYARCQRHALRDAAGLQLGRPVLHLPQGLVRHALRRGRGGRREDDVGRAALPAGRAPGSGRGAGALHRLRGGEGKGVAAAADRHRLALARAPP